MNKKFFIDTNILVYAHDGSEINKQKKAIDILEQLFLNGNGYLSIQNLSEFFWIVTRKIPSPLSIEEGEKQIYRFIRSFYVTDINFLVLIEALRGIKEHNFSLWDAQIWASARVNQIPVVLSEDFSSGSIIEGISFINPFVDTF